MIDKVIGICGLSIYRICGIVALPIFLHGSERTRVALIDKKSNQILLGVTWISAQKWGLIGGGIKHGEDVLVAARREVKEETNFDLEDSELIFVAEKMNKSYFATYKTYIYIAYVDEFMPKMQRPEMHKMAWFKLDKLPKKLATDTINLVKNKLK